MPPEIGQATDGRYGFEDLEGNRIEGREAIAPVLEKLNDRWRFIGTAFFIAENGIIVTAKQVVEEAWTEHRRLYVVQFIGTNEYFDRPVQDLSLHVSADIAVGILVPAAAVETDALLVNTSVRCNHDHTTLVHMLNVAKSPQFGMIKDNPAAYVPKPNPQNERDRIASGEEWQGLLDAAAPHLRTLLIVLYTLGPRRGELLKLEWPDVDMQRKEFTLRHTKNKETRTVPMTLDVYKVFTELWQERRLDTQRVFLYNEKPIRDVKTAFQKACRRAGITNFRLHDLRHTASTNLRRAGVDAMTAMKIVGHKSEHMHRRYNTVQPEDLRRAVSQLASYQANTVITPASVASGAEHVSSSSMRP